MTSNLLIGRALYYTIVDNGELIMPQRQILTPEEVAGYLRVHPQTIYRRLRARSLPGAKIGGQWRIRKADLDEYLKGRQRPFAFGEEPLSAADFKEIRAGLAEIRRGNVVRRKEYRRKRSA